MHSISIATAFGLLGSAYAFPQPLSLSKRQTLASFSDSTSPTEPQLRFF